MSATSSPSSSTPASIRVWDPFIRLFHWTLAAGFFVAYLSAEENQSVHHFAGYLICGLIIARVVWGVIGTRHARFNNFIPGPKTVLKYLRGILSGKQPRYLGHNPLGGLMVIALLLMLLMTTLAGMALLGFEEHAGPLATWVHTQAWLNEHWVEEAHEFFANTTVLLVFIHVGGVLVESARQRENLVRAMITGRKRNS